MIMGLFMASALLSLVMILLNSLLGEKGMFSRELLSAFECGFDAKSLARLPFSLHFFLVALIFLIFDVEITLLIPLPLLTKYSMETSLLLLITGFLLILSLGVLVEWKKGALDWSS